MIHDDVHRVKYLEREVRKCIARELAYSHARGGGLPFAITPEAVAATPAKHWIKGITGEQVVDAARRALREAHGLEL